MWRGTEGEVEKIVIIVIVISYCKFIPVYHYIVDQTRIPTRNFDRLLGEIYGYLTEYQISGEVHRVTRLRTVPDLVETALRSGAKTIVVIGDDQNFLQLVELLAPENEVVLGYIPLVKDSDIARVLGVGDIEDASRAIARRRTERFDLGVINRSHFFTSLNFGLVNRFTEPGKKAGAIKSIGLAAKLRTMRPIPVKVNVDDKYNLSVNVIAGSVVNVRPSNVCDSSDPEAVSAHDQRIDLLLVEKMSVKDIVKYGKHLTSGCFEHIPRSTVVHGRRLTIDGPKNLNVKLGDVPLKYNHLDVAVSDNRIRVIVGKGRAV